MRAWWCDAALPHIPRGTQVAKATFRTVDDYVASHPPDTQRVLQQVRRAIRRALPKAEEVISYGIAGYRIHGATAIYFAGWKAHYSLYPVGRKLIAAFAQELRPYEVNAKGTARFPLDAPVPATLIANMAKFRAAEVAAAAADTPSKPKRAIKKRTARST